MQPQGSPGPRKGTKPRGLRGDSQAAVGAAPEGGAVDNDMSASGRVVTLRVQAPGAARAASLRASNADGQRKDTVVQSTEASLGGGTSGGSSVLQWQGMPEGVTESQASIVGDVGSIVL